MVTEEKLLEALMGLGLKEIDAEIYVFLAKKGPQKGIDIAGALSLRKQPLYRSLKSLQCKGCVKATRERPSRFSAVSIEEVVDLLAGANLKEAQHLEENRQGILSYWQTMIKKDHTQ